MFLEVWQGKELRGVFSEVWQRKELRERENGKVKMENGWRWELEVKEIKEIMGVKETAGDQGAEVDGPGRAGIFDRKLKVESKELEESFRPVPTTAGGRKFRPLRGWGKREVGIGAGESWPGEVPKREWRPTIKNNVTIINN